MVGSLGLSYLHRSYLWVFLAPVSALCAPSGHLATLRTDFSPLFCCGFLASLTSVSVLCRIPGLSSTSLARILRYGESPSLSMPVQTQSVGAFFAEFGGYSGAPPLHTFSELMLWEPLQSLGSIWPEPPGSHGLPAQ